MAAVLTRRDVLTGALGVLAACASPRLLGAQQASPRLRQGSGGQGAVRRLTDRMVVVDGGGSNVLAFIGGEGVVLVDGGAPKSFDAIMASLPFDLAQGKGANARVTTLFNTHHHVDQTGNNDRFAAGTKITSGGLVLVGSAPA